MNIIKIAEIPNKDRLALVHFKRFDNRLHYQVTIYYNGKNSLLELPETKQEKANLRKQLMTSSRLIIKPSGKNWVLESPIDPTH